MILFSTDSNVPLWTYTLPTDIDETRISNNGDVILGTITNVDTRPPYSHNVAEAYIFNKGGGKPVKYSLAKKDQITVTTALSGNGRYFVARYADRLTLFSTSDTNHIWTTTGQFGKVEISDDGEYIVAQNIALDLEDDEVMLFKKERRRGLPILDRNFCLATVAVVLVIGIGTREWYKRH